MPFSNKNRHSFSTLFIFIINFMKKIIVILLILAGINTRGICQGAVIDMHPHSQIYAMDFSTGNQVPAAVDQAIIFKGAFIDLVSNTSILRQISPRLIPGQKTFVITQMEPQANGNSFQLVLENKYQDQITTLATFVYSVDQNALLFLNPQTQNYEAVEVEGFNLNNLNTCAANANFNPPAANSMITSDQTLDNQPVDTDVAVQTVPPEMPVYEQPACPTDGYQWQPGFWAYSSDSNGYYWVPGSWVAAPQPGLVWTPPYWGYEGNVYRFHNGYWSDHVGYYGGVNYGYGYHGSGYVGGEWRDGRYNYNTAVVKVNVNIAHRYEDRTVIYRGPENHSSYNGRGGVIYRPNDREREEEHQRHYFETQEQIRNQRQARDDKSQFANNNGGRPANTAVSHVPPPANNGQNGHQTGNFGIKMPATSNTPGSVRNPVVQKQGGNNANPQPANNNIPGKSDNPNFRNDQNQQNRDHNRQDRQPNNTNRIDPAISNNNNGSNPSNTIQPSKTEPNQQGGVQNQNGQPNNNNRNLPVSPNNNPGSNPANTVQPSRTEPNQPGGQQNQNTQPNNSNRNTQGNPNNSPGSSQPVGNRNPETAPAGTNNNPANPNPGAKPGVVAPAGTNNVAPATNIQAPPGVIQFNKQKNQQKPQQKPVQKPATAPVKPDDKKPVGN